MKALTASCASDTAPSKNEWYTPAKYIDSARKVMGSIDFDPFSCDEANKVVQASRYLTIEDDAMSSPWSGPNVWMNPPFSPDGSGLTMRKVMDRFAEQYESGAFDQAIILTNAIFDTQWAKRLFPMVRVFCGVRKRIQFKSGAGQRSSSNNSGQVVWYVGDNPNAFDDEFQQYGNVLERYPMAAIAE